MSSHDKTKAGTARIWGLLFVPLLLGLTVLALVSTVSESGHSESLSLMSLPLPIEPAPHPRLRAIERVPRGRGEKDAIDFGALPTASSKVVSNRMVDSGVVAKILADHRQAKPKLGFSF